MKLNSLTLALWLAGATALAQGLPDKALDGADLVDLDSFKREPVTAEAAGVYTIQQDAVLIQLGLTPEGDTWKVERVFREPGFPEERQTYSASLADGKLTDAAGALVIENTARGLLVLETGAGGMIPESYWLLYRRE